MKMFDGDKERFLAAYDRLGNMRLAYREAHVSGDTVYRWRWRDPLFHEAVNKLIEKWKNQRHEEMEKKAVKIEITKEEETMNNIVSAYPNFNHVAQTLEFLGIRIHTYNKLRLQNKDFAERMDALKEATKDEAYKYHKPARDYNPVMLGWAPPRMIE